jgi:hypothetical protein
MFTFSVFISLISVAVVVGMAVVLVRILRAERRRSDARVASLSQMATADFLPEPEVEPGFGPGATSAASNALLKEPASAFLSETEADPVLEPSTIQVDDSGALFKEPASASPWSTRAAIAGGLALVMIVVLAIASLRSPTPVATTTERAQETLPLALVALGHTQNGASLTVAGRVQNPRGSRPVANLTATVFLFGQDGSFLTSGRSPLEVGTLDPGVESAFTVTIPVNGVVARYRVSFRDSSGHPVAHVDRRNSAALARNE